MDINTAMRKLHEAFRQGDPSLGCVSRASILHHIMKGNGLNPERKLFHLQDSQGNKIQGSSHCIVVLDGMVYDANMPESENPIELSKYKEMKRNEYLKLHLKWRDWSIEDDKNNPIDFIWHYLSRFDEDFQKEVKSLMQEEYDTDLKKYPRVKTVRSVSVE